MVSNLGHSFISVKSASVALALLATCALGGPSASWSREVPAAVAPAPQSSTPPNIVFITSDDHRWDSLGVVAGPRLSTPNLDRLAREGVHFRQATTNVSQCLPIRASLLTGLAAHTHGALAHHYQRPEASRPDSFSDLPTVSSLLQKAGYRTVLVGKWHLASDPWQVGFADIRRWLPTGAMTYRDPELAVGRSREMETMPGFTQEIFTNSALEFLGSPVAKQQPFLLWLAYTAPHGPFGPNPQRFEHHYHEVPESDLLPPDFPNDILHNDFRHYSQAVSHLDEQVGRILEALEQQGLADSTVVVFLGDNGAMMGERGVGAEGARVKVVPYESSVRVPLIIRAPGAQGFSGSSDASISTLDLPPTLLALAGQQVPAAWPGRDGRPALRHANVEGFEDAFSEWADDRSQQFGALAHRLVRTATHKLIVWKDPSKGRELYAVADDPHETTNLAGKPEHAPLERDLERRLRRWLEATGDPDLGRWLPEANLPR